MSDSDSDGEETAVLRNWRSLTTAEKNRLRQQIAAWLGENYTSTPGVLLLMELVYQHYTHFCSRNAQHNSMSQKVFSKILMENYPNVQLEQLGKRGKSSCYFVDLDILEGSDEYESVSKGRRLRQTVRVAGHKANNLTESGCPPAKCRKQMQTTGEVGAKGEDRTKGDGGEGERTRGEGEETRGEGDRTRGQGSGTRGEGDQQILDEREKLVGDGEDGIQEEDQAGERQTEGERREEGQKEGERREEGQKEGVSAGEEETGPRTWRSLTSEQKEAHREETANWLGEEYEVAPQICVLRTVVYHHYTDHCRRQRTVPATQAIFGRLVQKKFPSVAMRRLGVRGESKYYYMGIDIRSSSDHYAHVSAERVVCMESKPKNNRVHNGR